MALATYRHNETGELLELSEDWLKRYPKDPYTLLGTDELAKLEIEQRQATAAALGAQPYAPAEAAPETPAAAPAPGKDADDEDTPAPAADPRDSRRF